MSAKNLIVLPKRTARVTNLNSKPERHGDEREKRVDLSLEVVLDHREVDPIVRTRWDDASRVLWDDKGEPQFLDVAELDVDIVARGVAILGLHNHPDVYEFDDAVIKRVKLKPLLDRKASMSFQVRVDPTGRFEDLGQMQADEVCQFAFEALEPEDVRHAGEQQQALV